MLIQIFYDIDEFCKLYEQQFEKKLLQSGRKRDRKSSLTLSEIMTILVYYHHSGYKTFKDYYIKEVQAHLTGDFPTLVSYGRFIELQETAIVPMMVYANLHARSECTGISIIDSTAMPVCHPRRQYGHKTFKGLAGKGKTSVGWFFGFKVHLVITHLGEIVNFAISRGNIADNNKEVVDRLTNGVFGKLVGDKGYIGLFEALFAKGIELIHKIRSNMKNKLVSMENKLLLKKRGLVETVIGIMKEHLSFESTRHRSQTNFFTRVFATIIAYHYWPYKPRIATASKYFVAA